MHKKHKKDLKVTIKHLVTFGVVDVDAAQRSKSPYQLGFLDQGAPYFDFLKPLGFRSSVVCVMWCDVG